MEALELHGRIYYTIGELHTARDHFRKALKLDPDHQACKDMYHTIKSITDGRKKFERAQADKDYEGAAEQLVEMINVDINHRTVVPKARLDAWLQAHPRHWRELSRLACARLRGLQAATEDRDQLSVDDQVARRLVLSASNAGQLVWGHWRRRVRLPQEHLASMLGVSRQTINKALRRLERDGLLRLGYAEIEILQLEHLVVRAGTFDPVVYPGMAVPPWVLKAVSGP